MKINSDETYSDFEFISHEISFTKNSLEFYSVPHQLDGLYYWTVHQGSLDRSDTGCVLISQTCTGLTRPFATSFFDKNRFLFDSNIIKIIIDTILVSLT